MPISLESIGNAIRRNVTGPPKKMKPHLIRKKRFKERKPTMDDVPFKGTRKVTQFEV